jgi:hypothetical protein
VMRSRDGQPARYRHERRGGRVEALEGRGDLSFSRDAPGEQDSAVRKKRGCVARTGLSKARRQDGADAVVPDLCVIGNGRTA